MRNLKRALSLAVASVMLLGMMVVGTSAGYADVTSKHNEEAIEVVKAVGIMIGDDKGNFNPDQKVTRNEMAVVMANMLKLNVDDFNGASMPFTDVPAWAAPYVAACYAGGIVSGTSATTYSGSAEVTATQAALMMMKALGYFQFEKDFEGGWQLATVKQASEIELMDGISAGTNTALTRNEVAQLVLNALEADVVTYSGDEGTDIKTSDGTTIKVGYTIKYDKKYSTDYDYDQTEAGKDNMQLVEKLFKNKLIKSSATDDFKRPSTKWTYDGDKVGTYAEEADYTYTASVKSEDLYDDIGLSKKQNATVYIDGKEQTDPFVIKANDDDNKVGGKGTLTEVYVTKDSTTGNVESIKIVEINTYYGKITAVTTEDDERVVKVGTDVYETEGFAKNDKVIYTKVDKDIKSMALAEKLSGEITKKVGSAYYIDGTKYELSAKNSVEGSVGDEVDFYLDAYGYIIKMDVTSEDVTLDNLAYVIEADNARGDYAVLRLADGTKMTVDTDKQYGGEGADENLEHFIVSFKETDDGYELKPKSDEALNEEDAVDYEDDAVKMGGYKLNSKTEFLYNVDGDFKTYTGYKSAPAFKDGKVVAYVDDGVAVWVYVVADDTDETLDDLVYIAYDDADLVEEADDVKYYELNAIVDGEVTTIKLDEDAFAKLESAKNWGILTDNLKMDDDIVTDMISVSGIKKLAKDFATIEVEDEVITIGVKDSDETEAYAYVDDVAVYVVNDGDVSIIDVEDIEDDDNGVDSGYNPYVRIMYVLDDGKIDTIVLIEK